MQRGSTPLLLIALSGLAFIASAGLACAADRCADVAQSIEMLHDGDRYQETTLLFAAARFGCEPEARALIDRGAAIDAKDREGKTGLAKAAEANKLAVIKLLLDRGADVNARAVDGATPLFTAAKEDRGPAVAFLLERGADSNLPGAQGLRPLAAAAYNGSPDSVEDLLKHGADPNALDNAGKSAMVYAAGRAHAAVVALLIEAGVDVNRRYGHGLTALMWAAGHDRSAGVDDVEATIRTLIEHGAALDLKDARGLGDERAAALLAH